ncbi:MAG: GNAT family N-acetyltransferase, partial [Variibacter sp.]|nr:GNAT family N-acetyltransferase [Variibacter sp.]
APWQVLAGRALEPNVFYEPAFALPAATVFGRDLGAVLVWADAARTTLVGFFPARVERRRHALGPALLAGWSHPYAPLGVPLVDRDCAPAALRAWLDFVADGSATPSLLFLPFLPVEGAFARLLREELARRGGRAAILDPHRRALLAPGEHRADYLEHAVSAKKRKEFRRQGRRLSDRASVLLIQHAERADLLAQLDDFLRLESCGWKGSAGTAVVQHPTIGAFIRNALGRLAERGQASVFRLVQGEQAVAAAIVLRSGDTAWFWKIAYDEAEARASPGVQLTLELTRTLLAETAVAKVDSCATPDHTMIDHIWRERAALGDWLVAPDGAQARAFALACRLERARRALVRAAKALRRRLRGR